jgi:hypothetical protein
MSTDMQPLTGLLRVLFIYSLRIFPSLEGWIRPLFGRRRGGFLCLLICNPPKFIKACLFPSGMTVLRRFIPFGVFLKLSSKNFICVFNSPSVKGWIRPLFGRRRGGFLCLLICNPPPKFIKACLFPSGMTVLRR